MPIELNKISSSLTRSNTGKKETSGVGNTANHSSTPNDNDSASYGFTKGQIFRGQITNISPKEVTIELENGEILRAKYENIQDLSIGDGAKFRVISSSEQRITIKPIISAGAGLDHAVLKALDASGLPYSSKNEELVMALLENEYPVNRDMINRILQQSLKNRDISLTNLVLMNKAGLPIEPETTAMFEAYSNDMTDISSRVDHTFNDLLKMLDGLVAEGRSEEASMFSTDLLTIFPAETLSDRDELRIATDTSSTKPDLQTLSDFHKLLNEVLTNSEQTNTKETLLTFETTFSPSFHTQLNEFFQPEELLNIFTAFENSAVDAAELQTLLSGEMSFKDFSTLINSLSESELQDTSLLPASLSKFGETLLSNEKANLVSEFIQASTSTVETSEILKAIFSSPDITGDEKVFVLKSPEFRSHLQKLIKTNWSLSIQDLSEKDALHDFYQKMNQNIQDISELLSKVGSSGERFSEQLSSLKQNLNFLHTISHYYGYTELPVRINGNTKTGDLYVYSDRKNRKNAVGQSISCLLHLDMECLGAMNIRIELEENTVSTKFYLEDKESGSLIASHLKELDDAIHRQGLIPKSEVVKKKELSETNPTRIKGFNLVDDFLPAEIEKNHFTRYTFDVRA